MSELTGIITAAKAEVRNSSLDAFCKAASTGDLIRETAALDQFRRTSNNLYERVRALFFLYAIHRFHLPFQAGIRAEARIPFQGYDHLLKRRFEEAIEIFLAAQSADGPMRLYRARWQRCITGWPFRPWPGKCDAACGAVRGNQWMFRTGHAADYPLIRRNFCGRSDGMYPDPAGNHAGTDGPDAFRMERHFLSGDGFSGRRAGAERIHRFEHTGRRFA